MKTLKRDYNSTIVSMTDVSGKTGNVDYRDCREPSDDDLVEAARKYGLTTGIKFTITTGVGVKIRFTGSIVNGKLVRETEENRDLYALRRAAQAMFLQEKEKLEQYADCDFSADECLERFELDRDVIEEQVAMKKRTVWRLFTQSEYDLAMFNYVVVEQVMDRLTEKGVL